MLRLVHSLFQYIPCNLNFLRLKVEKYSVCIFTVAKLDSNLSHVEALRDVKTEILSRKEVSTPAIDIL